LFWPGGLELIANLITFIIPFLNSEKTIKSCIDSVRLQVLPENWNAEIIVVDNGSSDRSILIIKENFPDISLLFETIPGPGNARNLGLKKSRGTLIAFIDSDVQLEKDWSMVSIEKISSGEYAGGQGGTLPIGSRLLDKVRMNISNETTYKKHNHLYNIWNSFLTPAVNTSACIYHKKWIDAVNGFNPRLTRLEDRDLSTRIFLKGGILCDTKAQAKVTYDGNLITYLKRSYRSGQNFPFTVMSQIENHRIDKGLQKVSWFHKVIKTLSIKLFVMGESNGRKRAQKNQKLRIPKSRFMQLYLNEKLKKQTSPYLRIIELGETTLIIHLVEAKLIEFETVGFKEINKSSPAWLYE
jgi:glycosyltransferase involved in cell wall biosynthesis